MATKQRDAILTIDELAAYLKLSKSSLYHFARAGKVPGVKVGRHWRFHRQAIDEWVRNGTAKTRDRKSRNKRKKA